MKYACGPLDRKWARVYGRFCPWCWRMNSVPIGTELSLNKRARAESSPAFVCEPAEAEAQLAPGTHCGLRLQRLVKCLSLRGQIGGMCHPSHELQKTGEGFIGLPARRFQFVE